MGLIRTIVASVLLLNFVICVSAQDNPGKIVWSNLEKTYADFKDIRPLITLEERDWISWKMLPLYFLLYRFDDQRKNWVEGDWHLEDTMGMVTEPIPLRRGEAIPSVFYAGQFFEWEKGKGYFFISQNREKFPVKGRYRITFFYGIDRANPGKLDQYSNSPEFTLKR